MQRMLALDALVDGSRAAAISLKLKAMAMSGSE
jgi:hypothetical protein